MKTLKPYLIAAAAAVSLSAVASYGQNNPAQHDHATPPAQGTVMQQQQAMMANMQAEQQKLDDLVAQMNAATGPDKVERIAAAVNELATMHKRINGMMTMMMRHGGAQMPHQQ